ncbi:MAG TPA: hypothetical protein VI688_01805 [Anaerolineales bacterium]|nr:hypothetical protein [Anaerolineales bacterium]
MAGFRLWEHVTIEQLLQRLTQAVLTEIKHENVTLSDQFEGRLVKSLKRVLNEGLYASPACGTSSLCQPSEEGRAKPWSAQSASWGLVSRPDFSLE